MSDEAFRVAELSLQGFSCSHIMVMVGLDAQGESNVDLLRAMSGLSGGMGCGLACGALTGGCCFLGMYAGKGGRNEEADERLKPMLDEYVDWFRDEYSERYGGTDCAKITQGDPRLKVERCPDLILQSVQKAREILEAYDFPLEERRPDPQD